MAAVPRSGSRRSGWPDRVTCVGHVAGERARQVWAAADAFVLPSYSEGFSMAILEALACSLPCLITTACHFPELAEAGGGIVVEPTRDGVTRRAPRPARAVARASGGGSGGAGGALVERDYTWDQQADRLAVGLPLAGRRRSPAGVRRPGARIGLREHRTVRRSSRRTSP